MGEPNGPWIPQWCRRTRTRPRWAACLREKHGTTLTEAFRAINSPKKTGWEMPVEMSGHKALGFTAQKQIELSLCTENGSFSALEHCAAVSICLIYWYTYSIPCWTLHPRNSGGLHTALPSQQWINPQKDQRLTVIQQNISVISVSKVLPEQELRSALVSSVKSRKKTAQH